MKYLGKRYLYNFLKEQGFEIPLMKEFRYVRACGDEIFETVLEENDVTLFCVRGVAIYISVYERFIDSDWNSKRVEVKRLAYHLDENSMWIKHYECENGKIIVCIVDKEIFRNGFEIKF